MINIVVNRHPEGQQQSKLTSFTRRRFLDIKMATIPVAMLCAFQITKICFRLVPLGHKKGFNKWRTASANPASKGRTTPRTQQHLVFEELITHVSSRPRFPLMMGRVTAALQQLQNQFENPAFMQEAGSGLTMEEAAPETHQQPRGDGDDVGQRVFGGDVVGGVGNVAQDTSVDDGAEDEVNMADEDERQARSHQLPRPSVAA